MRAPVLTAPTFPLDLPRLRAHAMAQVGGVVLASDPKGWQFIAWQPRWTLETRGAAAILVRDGDREVLHGPPLDHLRRALDAWQLSSPEEAPPFWGGGLGYFSYDLGRQFERIEAIARDDLRLPDMAWGWYDRVIAVAPTGQVWLCVAPAPGEAPDLRARLEAFERELASIPAPEPRPAMRALDAPLPNMTPQGYREALAELMEHILAGDAYQANLSQRFRIPVAGDAGAWFERLCRDNPAPFAAFLHLANHLVVSASPERFLRRRGAKVETCPIKGTRPRGRSPGADARLAEELLASPKDRAEHLMIVDLERNDLGRVCEPGSVRVARPFELEPHPTVWHLVSTVEGRLKEGVHAVDLLRATFPGGSITGAPKIRAMALIEELEPTRRGIYTGSIGYLGRDGDLDLNIVIRTAVIHDGCAYVQVGGGIVADSQPEAEYQETLDKAAALFQTLELDACASS